MILNLLRFFKVKVEICSFNVFGNLLVQMLVQLQLLKNEKFYFQDHLKARFYK